jgi:hypothetical protein
VVFNVVTFWKGYTQSLMLKGGQQALASIIQSINTQLTNTGEVVFTFTDAQGKARQVVLVEKVKEIEPIVMPEIKRK